MYIIIITIIAGAWGPFPQKSGGGWRNNDDNVGWFFPVVVQCFLWVPFSIWHRWLGNRKLGQPAEKASYSQRYFFEQALEENQEAPG